MKKLFFTSYGETRMWVVFVAILAAVATLITGFIVVVNTTQKHYDRIHCTAFGKNSNRTVKFVKYSYWGWDCLTPDRTGRWIPVKQLRDVAP